MKGKILVIDDERNIRDIFTLLLEEKGYLVESAASGGEGLAKARDFAPDVLLLDMNLPDMSGLEVLSGVRERLPSCRIIIITAYGTIRNAVEATRLGAYAYLEKPVDNEELLLLIGRALEVRKLETEVDSLRGELRKKYRFSEIIGTSAPMNSIFQMMDRIAPVEGTVLVTGESGTGKELVAREVHARSRRKDAPFVALDCGLPESHLEGELFGYAPGSRPGLPEGRHGRFELAHGGTIFLKEISHVPLRLQGDLVRAIETGEVFRLGSTRPISVDVRLIAASSVNLVQAVSRGTFREDLFYRLNVVPIHLPPLRERKEDLPLLVEHFLKRYSGKAGKAVSKVSTRAMIVLTEYDWPGNIGELDNTIERAVVLAKGDRIEVEDLMSHGISLGIPALAWAGGQFKPLEDLEKEYIQAVLRDQKGNKGRTASILGIDRKTLWAKVKKYGLEGRESS